MRYLTDGTTLWEVVDEGPTWITLADAADPKSARRTLGRAAPGMRPVAPASAEETAAWVAAWRAEIEALEACVAAT